MNVKMKHDKYYFEIKAKSKPNRQIKYPKNTDAR